MAAASPVDVAVNPNDTAQRYILWGNGRIDAIGGAVPITGQQTWFDDLNQPTVVALHITNWTTGAGYMLDRSGACWPLNGAPANALFGVPYMNGLRRYVDWSWDPAGTGQGYVLDQYGQLFAFGGATAPSRSGPLWSFPAAKKLQMQWTPVKRGAILDMSGEVWAEFGATIGPRSVYWRGQDNARDLQVTSWTTGSGYVLDLYGAVWPFGSATPSAGGPYQPGADRARALYVLNAADPARFWQVWSGGQQFEYTASTPPTVSAGSRVDEVQTVTIGGAPTGGTFTLTFSGQTTAAIARAATAATVQTALRALSNIGATGVTVTGAAGGPWTVTFGGPLAGTNVAQMTATSSLTGGTSPTVTVATATDGIAPSPAYVTTSTTRPVLAWSYSDPQSDSQAAWQVFVFTEAFAAGHTMTDPAVWATSAVVADDGITRTVRGITCPVDLPNGSYRLYVRAQDTSGQWSSWSVHSWTQNVPVPATPTGLSATANQVTLSVALSVSATTGGTANLIRFDASDDAGVTWSPLVGADAVPLTATTTAVDRFPGLGIQRTYRAVAYATDPAVASNPSTTAQATVATLGHALHAVDDPNLGGRVRVQEPFEWVRPVTAGVFQGLGADYPTVVKDGRPKAARGTLHLLSLDSDTWDVIDGLADSGSTLVYRGPFGDVRYCELVGDWPQRQVRAAPTEDETTPLRYMHTTELPLVEVRPPVTGS